MIGARSPVLRLGVRAASPLAVVVGFYLLFAGHNNPGGGFAAGLVWGAVITLRVVTGLQEPTHATQIITAGMVTVALVAIAPLFFGNVLLDQQIVSTTVPLLGKVKSGSALPFDIGVTAIVIGLVIALLDGLGATELDEPFHDGPSVSQPSVSQPSVSQPSVSQPSVSQQGAHE